MAETTLLSEIMLEEKLVELWPDYGCLYDVRSPDFEIPGFEIPERQVAIVEFATKLAQNGIILKVRNLKVSAIFNFEIT